MKKKKNGERLLNSPKLPNAVTSVLPMARYLMSIYKLNGRKYSCPIINLISTIIQGNSRPSKINKVDYQTE
jgi:hypothetical protein